MKTFSNGLTRYDAPETVIPPFCEIKMNFTFYIETHIL